jgi:hypothetical protein
MMCSSQQGCLYVIRKLLNQDVDVANAQLDSTTSHVSYWPSQHTTVVAACRCRQTRRTPRNYHQGSDNSYLEIARLLLKNGLNTNTYDSRDSTLLHTTDRNSHLDIVKL